jgi:hypothetical protein
MSHPAGQGRRTVAVSITYGELCVDCEADGVYSPDGVHDLVGQVVRGFNESLAYLRAHGFAHVVADGDDDEDDDE